VANKGEWGEPYAALRMLGDGKLYIADKKGNKNPEEWMNVLELIRHEAIDRIVTYRLNALEGTNIEIAVNNNYKTTVSTASFLNMAGFAIKSSPISSPMFASL